MADSGIRHIDVGAELTRTEWESQESHELLHGTEFPASPAERQLFYRDDEHKWYIYDGSAWVWLGGCGGGGGMEVHGNEYHDPAFEEEGVAASLVETHRTTETHTQPQPAAEHGNEKHDPDFATEAALAAHEPATSGVHGAGANTLWHGGLTDIINKTHLSQDFGSSTLRLHAWNFTPKQGRAMGVDNAATSPFSAKINGSPSATSVNYDNETNENCLKGIGTGPDRWGRFVLHNTTRGNSRLITDFDETINKIYTESSTDDWADDDDITLQSQTCAQAGYMDVDLSDEVSADEVVALITIDAVDKSAGAQSGRRVIIHPFAAYAAGSRGFCNVYLAGEKTTVLYPIEIKSQKICVMHVNCTDVGYSIYVTATLEYADT